MADAAGVGLLASVVVNVFQGVANVVQGLLIARNRATKDALVALERESASLRRQLGDLRSAQRNAHMKMLARESRIREEYEAERFKVLRYLDKVSAGGAGEASFRRVASISLAAAELVAAHYNQEIEESLSFLSYEVARELQTTPEQLEQLLDADNASIEQRMKSSAAITGLMVLKAVRNLSAAGLQTCALMTQLPFHIMRSGLDDFRKPVPDAVNEFLADHPLLGKSADGRTVSMQDIEARIRTVQEQLAKLNSES